MVHFRELGEEKERIRDGGKRDGNWRLEVIGRRTGEDGGMWGWCMVKGGEWRVECRGWMVDGGRWMVVAEVREWMENVRL